MLQLVPKMFPCGKFMSLLCNLCRNWLRCPQAEDEVVVQTPEITQRVHHATDEEKLASTGQTTDSQEEKGESECNKASGKKQTISDISVMDGM